MSESSRTRKTRKFPRGEQIQSSREIAGDDAIIRSPASSSAASRSSHCTVQRKCRIRLIRTCATRAAQKITNVQIRPGPCRKCCTSPRFSAIRAASWIAWSGFLPRVTSVPPARVFSEHSLFDGVSWWYLFMFRSGRCGRRFYALSCAGELARPEVFARIILLYIYTL